MPPANVILYDFGLGELGDVHNFFTQTCAIHMDKYVPMRNGILRQYTIDGNQIIYNPIYAEYQYYGISKNGKELEYNPEKHPLATSYWDKHMWNAEQKDVINEVQQYIRSRK